jgi:hypothetical protein
VLQPGADVSVLVVEGDVVVLVDGLVGVVSVGAIASVVGASLFVTVCAADAGVCEGGELFPALMMMATTRAITIITAMTTLVFELGGGVAT